MNIFVTGATGYLGSAIVEALVAAGHKVMGLVRSEAGAAKLRGQGVEPCAGSLADTALLRRCASASDAVIHAALDTSAAGPRLDESAVRAMLGALAGTKKLFIYTSGTWVIGDTKGHVAAEIARLRPPALVAWRPAVEQLVLGAPETRARGIVIRPAMVFGRGGGAPGAFVRDAKEREVVRIIGSGENHWSFVHIDGLAKLYVLAVESPLESELLLAADGPAYPVRALALATGAKIESIPIEQARAELGPAADAMIMDQRIMSTKAGRLLGWDPRYPNVLAEVKRGMAL